MTIATALKRGDRIAALPVPAPIVLTVTGTLFEPGDTYAPDGHVEVDVTCDPTADIWDTRVLATSVGAESACWLSNTPQRRYRLYYPAKTNVPTGDAR